MFKKLFKSGDKEDDRKRSKASAGGARPRPTRKHHQKINVRDLRVGMFVVELDKPWEESGFMFQGLEIKEAADIVAVQKECSFVYVDYDDHTLGKGAPAEGMSPGNAGVGSNDTGVAVEEEIEEATQVHTLATEAIGSLFDEIRLGADVDGGKVKQAVNGCVESILRNQDASVWLTRIQAKHGPTAQHSMNVSALSIIMAKAAGMPQRELEDVGVCAMLHDVGKTGISKEILDKTGPLEAAEMIEIQKHTRYGRDILLSTKSVMSGAADVAHSHHEREDGKGYPRRLNSDSIPVFAKIVAIAEAYDTMTNKQPYREARSPSEALQELYALRGKQFDEEFVIHFIDSVGIFPPGSIIELTNGEIGIVLANTSNKLRPRIIVILDATKEPVMQRVVDLSKMETDREGKVYQIKTTLSDGAYGIDVADFQKAGLRLG